MPTRVYTGGQWLEVDLLPQPLDIAATPAFAGLLLTGTGTALTANGDVVVRGGSTFWDASLASNGGTDLNWKVAATVGTASTLPYTGAEFEVDVLYKADNYASLSTTAPFKKMTFGITIKRSDGTLNDTDAGAVWGPVADYVRLVRKDIANWEIQIRQPDIYQIVRWRIRRVVHNNTTLTWGTGGFTGLTNGNLVGTTYVANTTYKYEHLFSKIDAKYAFIQPWVASESAIIIKGVAAQTADLAQWQDSTGSVMVRIAAGGGIAVNGTMINTSFGLSLTNKSIGTLNSDNTSNLIGMISFARGNTTGPWMSIGTTGDAAHGVAKVVITNSVNVEQVSVSQAGVLTMATNSISFGSRLNQHLNLYSTTYGIGIQSSTLYLRTNSGLAVYSGGSHADGQWGAGGGTELLRIDTSSFQYKNQNIWRDGITSVTASANPITNLNADLLDGVQGADYASRALLESVLGDLMYVGLYNASAYTNSPAFYLPNPTAVNANYLSLPAATRGADSSMDFRVDCDRPNDAVISRRPFQWGYYFVFNTDGSFSGSIFATDSTFPGIQASKAQLDAIAIQGARIQMRLLWNAATDQLTIYARAYTGLALTDDTGWTQLNQATLTGKILTGISITPLIGWGDGPSPFNGNIYGVAGWVWGTGNTQTAYVNGSPTYKVLPTDVGNIPSVTSFTCSTGQTVTVVRAATAPQTTLPTQKPVPTWVGTNTTYRHGMYWIASSAGQLDFITTDLSGRLPIAANEQVEIFNGDWIVALNPLNDPAAPNTNLTLSQVVFQVLPFSTETFIKAKFAEHALDANDPHSAAKYLLRSPGVTFNQLVVTNKALTSNVATLTTSTAHGFNVGTNVYVDGVDSTFNGVASVTAVTSTTFSFARTATNVTSVAASGTVGVQDGRRNVDEVFTKIGHVHTQEIDSAIAVHASQADPHSVYLLETVAADTYALKVHRHDELYEPLGAVAAHANAADPHPQYLTTGEGNALYAPLVHNHNDLYYLKAQVDAAIAAIAAEVYGTDKAASHRVFIGFTTPTAPAAGDIWIETLIDPAQAAPAAATSFTAVPTASSVALTWPLWPASSGTILTVNLDYTTNSTVATTTPTSATNASAAAFATAWVSAGSVTTTATTFTHSGLSENVTYYYRLRANNATGNGVYVFTNSLTLNAAPIAPSVLTTSAISATQITLSWTASTSTDLNASPYEVYLNGSSVATITGTSYPFTGLTENTTYSFGVRSRDSGFNGTPVLTSSIVTISNASTVTTPTTITRTGNAVPPAPTSLTTSGVTHNAATLSWAAGAPITANGHPSTGITDFSTYVVYLNGTQVATTTSSSYTFTLASPSTAYTLGVRSQDTGASQSALVTANVTTSVNPDTTAPSNPTVTSFNPEGSYGLMVLRITHPTDTDLSTITIQRSTDGATWVTDGAVIGTQGTLMSTALPSVTTTVRVLNGSVAFAAGTTVYARTIVTDVTGNSRTSGTLSTYTLIASPLIITADSSNSWRNTNGGEWNAAGNYQAYQGYFSVAAYNYRGLWFYGTNPYTQLYNSGRRNVQNVRIFLNRDAAGSSAAQAPTLYLHKETTNPGTVTNATAPVPYETGLTGPALTTPAGLANYGWSAYLGGTWAQGLVNGTYRGIMVYSSTGAPYLTYTAVSANGYSGMLEFTHLG